VTESPSLQTERLLLRGWREEDLDDYARISADPEVMRFLGGTLDRNGSWRQMALQAGHWTLRGYGIWAVERRSDRRLVGRVGLWRPEGWPGLEVGWTLAREAWGNGYATEAAAAAIEWAWRELDASGLISLIRPENHASIRVARRLGMRELRPGELDGHAVMIWGLEAPERIERG
jgi:RimJ/RimL family protein N-acetyltransferase